MPKPRTVTRYVATVVNKDGTRTLMSPAQGRFTYATAEEAQEWLDAIMSNNAPDRIASIWGAHDLKPEVLPCECWAGHFDPVSIYFD